MYSDKGLASLMHDVKNEATMFIESCVLEADKVKMQILNQKDENLRQKVEKSCDVPNINTLPTNSAGMSNDHSDGEHEEGLEVHGQDLMTASKHSFDDTARRKSTQRGGSPTA